jgi:hypothetical protein
MLSSVQHSARLASSLRGEAGGSRDLNIKVLEGEILRRRQSTTKGDEAWG